MGGSLTHGAAAGVTDHDIIHDHGTDASVPVRRRITPATGKRGLIAADAAALAVGFALAFVVQRAVRPVPGFVVRDHLILGFVSLPAFVAGGAMSRMWLARANDRPEHERSNVVRAVAIGVAGMLSIAFAFKFGSLSRFWVALVAVCAVGALLAERAIARRIFRRLRSAGALRRRIVIVGTDINAVSLLHMYQRNPQVGYEVVGLVGPDDIGRRGDVEVLGGIDDLDRVLAETMSVGVVVSLPSVPPDDVNRITRQLTDDGYHVAISSCLTDIDLGRLRPQAVDGRTMLYVEPVIRGGWRASAKRVFDLVSATSILVVTAPIWIAAAIAVKLDSPGPVFYRQERIGRDGVPFVLTKFRTMEVGADQRLAELAELNEVDGPLFKIKHDPRVTRVGRILRKLSIDELPQLLTVFSGRMSMVGPRPALAHEVTEWDEQLRDRLRVLPGLTGMWQVSGRSSSSFDDYRRLDLYYVDNWSLAHDLRICARTVGVVLSGRGAS